jgi:hypothetical protein
MANVGGTEPYLWPDHGYGCFAATNLSGSIFASTRRRREYYEAGVNNRNLLVLAESDMLSDKPANYCLSAASAGSRPSGPRESGGLSFGDNKNVTCERRASY